MRTHWSTEGAEQCRRGYGLRRDIHESELLLQCLADDTPLVWCGQCLPLVISSQL